MIKIVTIIGARPQIIKAAALSRAIKQHFSNSIQEIIVHTGQHYDESMSSVFFDELSIPYPNYNLNAGSSTHGKQTSLMIVGIEDILEKEKPDCVVVYGDTNSTIAASIAASKIHIPLVHIEAGLRSFNKSMPEEVNRIVCDHVSTLLFAPTEAGYKNLLSEGFKENRSDSCSIDDPKIFHCGDVMFDNSLFFADLADSKTSIVKDLELDPNGYILATIHRDSNTDDPTRLRSILESFDVITKEFSIDVVLPLHPRTSKMIKEKLDPGFIQKIESNHRIKQSAPVSFLEMTALERNSKLVITDSGGVQKEAFFFKKPCVILRAQTEWVELVECGSARLADANAKEIISCVAYFFSKSDLIFPDFFGDGKTAEFICKEILSAFKPS